MKTLTLHTILSSAAKSPHWWGVPEAIHAFRSAGGSAAGSGFWRQAGELVGRPEHALRQMCVAYDLIISRAKDLGSDGVQRALSRPYTQTELIARLAKVDPALALELLDRPLVCNSVARLRQELARARQVSGAVPTGLVQGHQALNEAKTFVVQQMSAGQFFSVRAALVAWTGATRFVSPTMVVARRTPSGTLQAEAVLVTAKIDEVSADRAVAKAAFESTFFDRYWLALPNAALRWTQHGQSSLVQHLRNLGLTNVGLVEFEVEQSTFRVVIQPEVFGATPDRRPLLHLPRRYFG